MTSHQPRLQDLCEVAQQELERMEYLRAEKLLMRAESIALEQGELDVLSRLYMPLQECRRQRRQRCGEGILCLDLVSAGPADQVDARRVIENYPHGQLLVGGWGTIEPALKLRELQFELELYVETFLAAAYPITEAGRAIVVVPLPGQKLPEPLSRPMEELKSMLPPHCIVLNESDLPQGSRRGTAETFARVMSMWEELHAPFLAEADRCVDSLRKLEGYRRTIRVDYACELAHQRLSDAAREAARTTAVRR